MHQDRFCVGGRGTGSGEGDHPCCLCPQRTATNYATALRQALDTVQQLRQTQAPAAGEAMQQDELLPPVTPTEQGGGESSLPMAHPGYQVLSDILFRLGLIANALTQCSA